MPGLGYCRRRRGNFNFHDLEFEIPVRVPHIDGVP
jgi:hypothetical protein